MTYRERAGQGCTAYGAGGERGRDAPPTGAERWYYVLGGVYGKFKNGYGEMEGSVRFCSLMMA